MKRNKRLLGIGGFLVFLAAIISCNSEFDKMLPEKDYTDTVSVAYGDPKVLYIIVDGARGTSVQAANTPNIDQMLPNSIYSWVSLNDSEVSTDLSNWATMLTGVRKEKHGIENDTANAELDDYPTVLKRVKELRPEMKVVSYAASEDFKDSFTEGADESLLFSTDEEIKTALVNNLTTDTASFITAEFNDIKEAGEQYGYDNSFPEYKSAIEKFDSYVGEIMAALKSRPNYNKESWMVVIASSGGGPFTIPDEADDQTVFSNTNANTFTIFYNSRFNPKFIGKPFIGNKFSGKAVRLDGEGDNAVRAEIDTADIFNLEDTVGFTIELKVKKNEEKFFWPSILGKRGEWSGGGHPTVGWVIYLEDKYWYFEMKGSKMGNTQFRQARGADLQPGKWHTLTARSEFRDGKKFVRVYTDGIYNSEVEITPETYGSITNDNFLKLGYLNGNGHGFPDVYVADIRFFKFSLPESTISNYACQTSIDEGHPYYQFLAGYWPGTDGQGDRLVDLGPQARDFMLKGNYSWDSFSDYMCPPSADYLATQVPFSADIPSQILNWLKIANKPAWNLDGRVWLDQ